MCNLKRTPQLRLRPSASAARPPGGACLRVASPLPSAPSPATQGPRAWPRCPPLAWLAPDRPRPGGLRGTRRKRLVGRS